MTFGEGIIVGIMGTALTASVIGLIGSVAQAIQLNEIRTSCLEHSQFKGRQGEYFLCARK